MLENPVLPILGPVAAAAFSRPLLNGVKVLFGFEDTAEVRVNGARNQAASERLRAMDWPRSSDAAYARCYFLFVHEHPTEPSPPGTLAPTNARDAILIAVEIIAQSPSIGELELVAALERKGFSHLHAEKLCVFIPSAFTWALLKRMGVDSFPNHYRALDRYGKGVSLPIANERYFNAALQLACDRLEHGWSGALTKDQFQSVVVRSAEYGALNQALHAGKALEGAKVGPFCIVRIPAEAADEK
jgi:hypothetical protein